MKLTSGMVRGGVTVLAPLPPHSGGDCKPTAAFRLSFPLLLLSFSAFSLVAARAAIREIAHYKLAGDGNSNGMAPDTLKDTSGNGNDLKRFGAPKCMANSPEKQSGGAYVFNGPTDWYTLGRGIGGANERFVLEAWARAAKANDPGLHGVVSHGDGAEGYTLGQQGDQWVVFLGGTGGVTIGRAAADQWTHLAIVTDETGSRIFLNGVQTGECGRSGLRPKFTIGDMGNGREAFDGMIHEVRLSSFAPGQFDPMEDLLVDNTMARKAAAENRAERAKMIASLTRSQPGVRVVEEIHADRVGDDWLLKAVTQSPRVQVQVDEKAQTANIQIGNGLISRRFFAGQNLVCYSIRNESSGLEFLRSIKPETRIKVAGRWYDVGGLKDPPARNYTIPGWLPDLRTAHDAFLFDGFDTGSPEAWLPWTPRYGAPAAPWPPKGLRVSMHYRAPDSVPALEKLRVTVNYEIYEGIPVIGKWVSFENLAPGELTVEEMKVEELATVDFMDDQIFVESEYSFFRNVPTRWTVDPEFGCDSGPVFTERMSDLALKYWSPEALDKGFYAGGPEWEGEYRSRSLMTVSYPVGPWKALQPGETWSSFKAWELFQDSRDPERKGLARREVYRHLMPWTQENPIYMHILNSDSASIRRAVDQCAAVGFDMAVLTYGSGLDMMSKDPDYISRVKADFDYAHSKGIKIGAYILFCSSANHGSSKDSPVPDAYGGSMCLGSSGSDAFFAQVLGFMDKVGADLIETDGPYHGFPCESKEHKYHRQLEDSYRVNWERMRYFYSECVKRGVYIISPDWYFACGSDKMPMGYKEAQWGLPRPQQLVISRQNTFDGTWWRTPSMCYAACPLVSAYGGPPITRFEPLNENLTDYDSIMGSYFGMGIQGVYRGTRLYDTEATRRRVHFWTDFFHKYSDLVNADIIHIRRADGRDLDAMMHVNPGGKTGKGLAFIWNPLPHQVTRDFELPLYYTGLTDSARIHERDGPARKFKLDRDYKVRVPVTIPAGGHTWLVIE